MDWPNGHGQIALDKSAAMAWLVGQNNWIPNTPFQGRSQQHHTRRKTWVESFWALVRLEVISKRASISVEPLTWGLQWTTLLTKGPCVVVRGWTGRGDQNLVPSLVRLSCPAKGQSWEALLSSTVARSHSSGHFDEPLWILVLLWSAMSIRIMVYSNIISSQQG